MTIVKILGPGCANCRKLEAVAREAALHGHVDAQFVKVTDIQEIIGYDVLTTPGLVVDDKLVCSGRIPSVAEVEAWMQA